MNKFRIFSITVLLLTAGSVLGQDVRYNFDDKADFPKFKTYTWVVLKNAKPVDDLTDKQIKAAVDAALLTPKGLTKIDGDTADLYIGYEAAVGTQQELTVYSTGWGYGPGWYGGGWYGPTGGITYWPNINDLYRVARPRHVRRCETRIGLERSCKQDLGSKGQAGETSKKSE